MPPADRRRAHRRGLGLAAGLVVLAGLVHATPPVLKDFDAILPLLQAPARARLQRHAAQWTGWSAAEQARFTARAAAWDALPRAARDRQREEHAAWQSLPSRERAAVRSAAAHFSTLPPEQQQALRGQFDQLDRSEQRGWLLGPVLGADYPALQPLLAQVPPEQHAPLLQVLRALSPSQRADVAVLARRTPPHERAELRRELLSTAAGSRERWLWDRLGR